MGWILAVVVALAAAQLYALWRRGIKDRHNLVQFIILMFLNPNVDAAQRENFLNLLKRIDAKDSTDLGGKVLLAISQHAGQVASDFTAINADQMWKVRIGTPYGKL